MLISKAVLIAIVAVSAVAGGLATSFVASPTPGIECAPSTPKDGDTFQHVQPRRGPSKGY